jgi:hypothetical protein
MLRAFFSTTVMKVEEAAAVLSSPLSRQFSAPTLRLSASHSAVFFSQKNQSDQPHFTQTNRLQVCLQPGHDKTAGGRQAG